MDDVVAAGLCGCAGGARRLSAHHLYAEPGRDARELHARRLNSWAHPARGKAAVYPVPDGTNVDPDTTVLIQASARAGVGHRGCVQCCSLWLRGSMGGCGVPGQNAMLQAGGDGQRGSARHAARRRAGRQVAE